MTTGKTGKTSYDKLALTGIPEGLSQEEIDVLLGLQARLTEFVLHLIQAFLRTGYYTPDHPESKKAQEGLYNEFKNLFKLDEELTFFVREDQEGPEILVEGVLPEMQKLSRMMIKGMGELYVPKFAKFLERKELISLTLINRMGQTEFTRLIDIMSDPTHLDMRRKEDKERFTQTFYSHGVFNVSFIFSEEVLAPDRDMPWRARLTLSRMSKDLTMIPYLQKKSAEELREIGKNLVQDAIRAIRPPELLCAVLQNSDIAASERNPEGEIEDIIIAFLQPSTFVGTSKFFLHEHLAVKKLQRKDAFEEKSDRLVTKIVTRLRDVATSEANNLLEDFFRQDLIKLDDLPPPVKEKILLERLTDKFLNYAQVFFQLLDQAKEKTSFLNVGNSFAKMIPELIRRDRYPEVLRIIEALRKHFAERKMWALLAGQVLEEIASGKIPTLLEEKFLTGKKEIRATIIPIFIALEAGAIPHLLNILRKSEDQWVRKNACEALIRIGPIATAHLLDELKQQKVSVETTCDILRVLGEIRSEEWKTSLANILRNYVSHDHPKLRDQALHTYCLIVGKQGEELFLSRLDDPDREVQRRAAWCLGMIRSTKGIQKMLEKLKNLSSLPASDAEPLETQIYLALGLSGNLTVEGGTVEQILLDILEKRGIKQWWGLFDKHPLGESSLEAIVDALGRIGTKESLRVLAKLEKAHEEALAAKVREALKRIEGRGTPSPS